MAGTQDKPSGSALYTRVMFTDAHPSMIVEGSDYFSFYQDMMVVSEGLYINAW